MKLLLDTCTISELRRPNCHPAIRQLVAETPDNSLFLSVISIGEIAKGITLLPNSRRKAELTNWLAGIHQAFADRILPIDGETADIWGQLTAQAQTKGKVIPMADGLIAATARQHSLSVVTRNSRDFEETGVFLIDPWAIDPWEN